MIDLQELRSGADVFTAEGSKLGSLADIQEDVLVVKRGRIFRNRYVVPRNAVSTIDTNGIHLRVSSDQIGVLGADANSASQAELTGSADTFPNHAPSSANEKHRISVDTGTGEKDTKTGREYGKE